MAQLDQFTIDKNHPIQTNDFYVTYLARENSSQFTFRADFIKKKIVSEEDKAIFENCCKELKSIKYFPTWLPFYDGILTHDGQAVLLWRCPKDLISLRDAISLNEQLFADIPECLRFLAYICQAMHFCAALKMKGHLRLTLENVLVDPSSKIPILQHYGLHGLWLQLYGEEGKVPVLICPPRKMGKDQKEIEQLPNSKNKDNNSAVYDSYAFGSLMYQLLTKKILDEKKPFDKNLVDQDLPGNQFFFLREIIKFAVSDDKNDFPQFPFLCYRTIFISIIQQKMNNVLLEAYCRKCLSNGDQEAGKYLEKTQKNQSQKVPFIRGIPDRNVHFQAPTSISFIIGKKVFHDIEGFNKIMDQIKDQTKRVIFISIFGGYQKGKSTTLSLLSGNGKYVIGNGSDETTRGVSIDGPYNLSDFSKAFEDIPQINKDFKMFSNEDIKKEDPYVFLIDIEGFDGDINGYSDDINKQLYRDLVRPYMALSANVMFICDKNEGRSTRDFAVDNLAITKFSNLLEGYLLYMMLIVRQVDKISYLGENLDYDDPFDKSSYDNFAEYFKEKFEGTFEENGITTSFCPLGLWDSHFQSSTAEIPKFDKSFIIMARTLLSDIYMLNSSKHITNGVGAINLFKKLSETISSKVSKKLSDQEDAKLIQDEMDNGFKTMLVSKYSYAKEKAINEINPIITQEYLQIDTLNPSEMSLKRIEWTKKLMDFYEEHVKTLKLSDINDIYAVKETVWAETKQIVEDLIMNLFVKKGIDDIKSYVTPLAIPQNQ